MSVIGAFGALGGGFLLCGGGTAWYLRSVRCGSGVALIVPVLGVVVWAICGGEHELAVGSVMGGTVFLLLLLACGSLLAVTVVPPVGKQQILLLWLALGSWWVFARQGQLSFVAGCALCLVGIIGGTAGGGGNQKIKDLVEVKQRVLQTNRHSVVTPSQSTKRVMFRGWQKIAGLLLVVTGTWLVVWSSRMVGACLKMVPHDLAVVLVAPGMLIPAGAMLWRAWRAQQMPIMFERMLSAIFLLLTLGGGLTGVLFGGVPLTAHMVQWSLPFLVVVSGLVLFPVMGRGKTSRLAGGMAVVLFLIYGIFLMF